MSGLLVLKLGSSVLPNEDALPEAVDAIYAHVRQGTRVIAVVSALGDETDRLWRRATALSDPPEPAALAALLATGEATTVALLCLALDRAGVPALPVDPELRTIGAPLDAEPVALDRGRIRAALDRAPVVVLPGFVGRDFAGTPTVLGRGGSDLTAIFVAQQLGADCRLAKDVDGLYDREPGAPDAARFSAVTFTTARRCAGRAIQPRALRLAEQAGVVFDLGHAVGPATRIGAAHDAVDLAPPTARRPLRVALLGLGTVGGGVYARLKARPDRYEVVAAIARDPAKYPGIATGADPLAAVTAPVDVVVEALGGLEPATAAVRLALLHGRHVVTANKQVIAAHGVALHALARRSGVSLLSSAAVGGAVPAIEAAVRWSGRIRAIEGVLNGTTNFVLDQLAAGCGWDEALARARARGLCEANPWQDLDGEDAANKLVILARQGFGAEVTPHVTPWRPPEPVPGGVIRQIARLERRGDAVIGTVAQERLPDDHPLAGVRGEENAVLLHTDAGTELLRGKGAGRWPTTGAVLADLDALRGAPCAR